MHSIHYINSRSPEAASDLSFTLSSLIHDRCPLPSAIVLLCIGTDRVTGDSLGPLTGYKLMQKALPNLYIYGTLAQPVHALNLETVVTEIKRKHPKLPVVAVDASFGDRSTVDYVTLYPGSLEPGVGVDKSLGAVGDIAITGIVNAETESAHSFAQLQATRLHTVMCLADVIAEGIAQTAAAITAPSQLQLHCQQ